MNRALLVLGATETVVRTGRSFGKRKRKAYEQPLRKETPVEHAMEELSEVEGEVPVGDGRR